MKLIKLQEDSYDVPAKLQDLIVAGRYDDAYKYASSIKYSRENPGQTQERGQASVIDAYLKEAQFPVGDKGGGAVVRFIIKSLGMGKDNPFLDYIANYSKAHELSKAFWIALNNAYAEPIRGQYMIDAVDLQNPERGKVSLLLYNDGLFDNNEPEHLTDILWSFRNFETLYRRSGKSLPTEPLTDEERAAFKQDIQTAYAITHELADNEEDVKRLSPQSRLWLVNRGLIDAEGKVTQRYGEGRELIDILYDVAKGWDSQLSKVRSQDASKNKDKKSKSNKNKQQLKQMRNKIFFNERGLVRPWEQIEAELPKQMYECTFKVVYNCASKLV